MGISDDLFIDPTDLGYPQLFTLILLYAFILFKASKLIADGSELLMLVLSPGLIGGLVLPVMGAVPDGAIVLFSGLGSDAQAQLDVGIGTLAGSTIMLLTIPWAASMIIGRVDLNDAATRAVYGARPKLTRGWACRRTGVQIAREVPIAAGIMLATAATYFIVQGAAWANATPAATRACALAGLIVSTLAFMAYSTYQVLSASSHEVQKQKSAEAQKKAVQLDKLSLFDLYVIEREKGMSTASSESINATPLLLSPSDRRINSGQAPAVMTSPQLNAIMYGLFSKFDADHNGCIDKNELRAVMVSLKLNPTSDEVDVLMEVLGGTDERISFQEFHDALLDFMARRYVAAQKGGEQPSATLGSPRYRSNTVSPGISAGGAKAALLLGLSSSNATGLDDAAAPISLDQSATLQLEEDFPDEDEEERSGEEDDNPHSPAQIKLRAMGLLILGVGLVTVFSDPMVSVLSALGAKSGIPAFYIAFIINPLVSNASELISSVIFSGRKTSKSITMTFQQLLGAASMNNTFCMSIFLALVYFRNLEWHFSAEVTAIVIIEVIMAVVATRRIQPLWFTAIPMLLYPGSIGLVAALEYGLGMN